MFRFMAPAVLSVHLALTLQLRAQDLGAVVQTNVSGAVTNVIFRVWAPNAVAVHLAGDFNGWATNSGTALSKTNSANGIWSLSSASARPGHAYKYAITASNGAVLWRKDPRARQVRTLTGGVPPYVTNGSSQQASVVYNASAFDWTGDTFVPPEPKDIVMYELHIGTFNDPTPLDDNPATFDDAIQRLDYLKELGVNMIALMPVSEFSGRHSWGYNPSDPFAIEETYGGPDAFKRFVKAAHLRGMAVQVDVVHNHYGTLSTSSATWQSARLSDLENFDGGQPYFYHAADEVNDPGISKTKWGPRPRYSDPNVRSYIKDNIKMYLDEYKVWALRWDSPRNITGYQRNPAGGVIGDPDTEIPQAVAMMEEIHAEISSNSRPNASRYYSIAEDASVPGGYTGHWEISYHDAIFSRLLGSPLQPPFAQKYVTPASMGSIKFRLENKEDPGFRVVFLENHDKCGDLNSATDGQRLAHDFDTNNPTSVTAKSKTLMAAAATLTAAGVPMLWMGQEQLANGDFNDESALDWNRAAHFPGIIRFHRDLIHLRKSLPALRTSAATTNQTSFVSVVHTNDISGVLAFRRSDGVSLANDVLVAMNFAGSNNTLPASALAGGFTNILINSRATNYDAQLTAVGPPAGSTVSINTNIQLGPWSVLVLAKTNVNLPPVDANGNGIDDGIDMLAGTRAALPGSFNNWDAATPAMKWDQARGVYWYVARFSTPGTNRFQAHTTDRAPGAEGVFVNASAPATWEITYHPGSHSYTSTSLGTATNELPPRWQLFWFGAANVLPGADADGDGWSNHEEFLRGSDPLRHEASRFAVVGQLNGWNWPQAAETNSPAQMRYFGHGLWKYLHWLAIGAGPEEASFKISQGPSAASPNWGSGSVDGFARYLGGNLAWLTGTNLEKWQVLTYNERTGAYRIEPLPAHAPDTDGDGMADDWEIFSRLNPFADDRSGDRDGDTVLNGREFARGSRADDPSDHFAAMSISGDAFPFSAEKSGASWEPSEQRVAMRWNTNEARWQALRYVPRPRELQFKFAANGSWSNAWNWTVSNNVPGIARKNTGTNNIRHTFASAGYHVVSFDEHSGRYTVSAMPTNDTTSSGVPDYWAWFHGLTNPMTDTDGDGVTEIIEYRRGSDPRRKDKSAVMHVHGHVSGWNFTNAVPMRWNAAFGIWEALVQTRQTNESPQRAKFVSVTNPATEWSNPNWGDDLPADGLSDRSGADIRYTLPALPSHVLFEFEEVWGVYSVGSLSTNDQNNDGLPDGWDEWAAFYGITDPGGNPDGDNWLNISEYRRGSNPTNADGDPKRMTVTGNNNAFTVPHWQPAANNMVWSDQRLRWEWTGTFGASLNVLFKFSQATNNANWTGGKSWGAGSVPGIATEGGIENISQSVVGGTRYLVHFDDITGHYELTPYPTWLGWLTDNGLAGIPRDPWLLDSDRDGVPNLHEYALGGNPNFNDRTALPVSVTTNVAGANRLVLRWLERTTKDSSLRVEPQASTNLTADVWQSLASSVSTLTDTNGIPPGHRRKEVSVPMDGGGRFLRLRIEGP